MTKTVRLLEFILEIASADFRQPRNDRSKDEMTNQNAKISGKGSYII